MKTRPEWTLLRPKHLQTSFFFFFFFLGFRCLCPFEPGRINAGWQIYVMGQGVLFRHDDRDKILGLLGLTSLLQTPILDTTIHHWLTPDIKIMYLSNNFFKLKRQNRPALSTSSSVFINWHSLAWFPQHLIRLLFFSGRPDIDAAGLSKLISTCRHKVWS